MTRSLPKGIGFAAVVVLALFVGSWVAGGVGDARAQTAPSGPVPMPYPTIGLLPGHEIRVSLGDPRGSACDAGRTVGQDRETDHAFIARLLEHDGTELFVSAPVPIPADGFGMVVVDRRELDADGEDGTGRLEVGLRVELRCAAGGRGAEPTATWQVVDADSGHTATRGDVLVGKITPKGA